MAYEMGRKSVLVTGATGLIGGRVAALLLSRGATVRVLARTSEKASRLARAGAERGRTGEAYILCGSEVVTVADFFGRLARMAGRNKIPSVPYWVGFSAAALCEGWARLSGATPAFTRSAVRFVNQRRTSFNGTKAEKELGFVPRTSLDSGLEAVHAWLQTAGIVKRAPSSQDGKA
jgi:nucleoside-diphosphate-sugar epimerase